MSNVDREVTGVFSGVLVACFICVIVLGQRPKAMECIATIKDNQGNQHEIRGVVYENNLGGA